MNWGIKLSTFAVAGLLSVGASAVNFVETGDDLEGMSFDFNTAGTYTIGGSLDSNLDNDSFSFTVGDGFLIESISLDLSNISTAFQAGDFNMGTMANVDNGMGGMAGTGGGFVAQFDISSAGLEFSDSVVPDNGNAPGAMGADVDNCGAMGCTLAVGDGANGAAAMGTNPPEDGTDDTISTPTALALNENDGSGAQLFFAPENITEAMAPFEAGDLDFPLNSGDFDFLLSVLSGANDATGSLDYLLTFEVSQVPIPAAAWLFVSALAGLFGFRRFFSSEAA